MACVISMKRNDLAVSWGFRLQGGADFRIPLSIKKVSSDSPAGIAGLSDGDVILKINGLDANAITHQEALNQIRSAQLELHLVAEKQKMSIIRPTLPAQKFAAPLGSELHLDASVDGTVNVTLGDNQVAAQPATRTVLKKKAPERKLIGTNSLGKPIYEGGALDLNAPKPFYG